MSLQKRVTDFYLKINNYPTLKFISEDTGMQITRTFRILNGAPMKLTEFEIFQQKVKEKMEDRGMKELILEETWNDLGPEELSEINSFIQKKIKIKKIKGNL